MRNLEFLCRGSESVGRGQRWRICLDTTFVQQAHCLLRMSVWSFLGGGVRAPYGGRGHLGTLKCPSPQVTPEPCSREERMRAGWKVGEEAATLRHLRLQPERNTLRMEMGPIFLQSRGHLATFSESWPPLGGPHPSVGPGHPPSHARAGRTSRWRREAAGGWTEALPTHSPRPFVALSSGARGRPSTAHTTAP